MRYYLNSEPPFVCVYAPKAPSNQAKVRPAAGLIEALSTNSRDVKLCADPVTTDAIKPLRCGQGHLIQFGSTGLDSTHWCSNISIVLLNTSSSPPPYNTTTIVNPAVSKGFCFKGGVSIACDNLAFQRATDAFDCLKKCVALKECVAWTFQIEFGNLCSLKWNVSFLNTSAPITTYSGIKSACPPSLIASPPNISCYPTCNFSIINGSTVPVTTSQTIIYVNSVFFSGPTSFSNISLDFTLVDEVNGNFSVFGSTLNFSSSPLPILGCLSIINSTIFINASQFSKSGSYNFSFVDSLDDCVTTAGSTVILTSITNSDCHYSVTNVDKGTVFFSLSCDHDSFPLLEIILGAVFGGLLLIIIIVIILVLFVPKFHKKIAPYSQRTRAAE